MMEQTVVRIPLHQSTKTVSGISIVPADATHLMVLAHGAGAGMEHSFMTDLACALASLQIGTLRFQFPYMELGSRRPDRPPVATGAIADAVAFAQSHSNLPLILGGKSFGGRMATHYLAEGTNNVIQAIVLYGFPLHSPAKPGIERSVHLQQLPVPSLFLQGDRDRLARLDLLLPVLQDVPNARLEILEGADHGFHYLKKWNISDHEATRILAEKTRAFLDQLTGVKSS